jgi:polar amino acid transport system ATP-binding protein
LRCVNYLEEPSRGHIYLEGQLVGEKLVNGNYVRMSSKELAPQRAEIGMVFQNFYLWPHLTARENVAIAPQRVRGMPKKDALALADVMLEKVHMAHKRATYPEQLSGGQQQRVAIARSLAMNPEVMLFDEVTAALDPETVKEVLVTIRDLAEEGMTCLLVTHEMGFARELADHMYFTDNGVIVEHGPPREFFEAPEDPRTKEFLSQIL